MPDDTDGRVERTEVLDDERVISGKFQLGAQIGEGGMGAVYLAKHLDLNTTVAIKLLGEAFVEHPTAVARFRREARALGAMRHENIVAVMDSGTDPDLGPYLAMEYLEGESLHSLLGRKAALKPETAVGIVMQMLEGLQAVHEQGIVHRDLKPANVHLIPRPGGRIRVKILDFGISKFLDQIDGPEDHKTATGAIVGTPKYLAPEQIHHRSEPDARTDLYAVGVCLYRMLTGRMPYRSKDRAGLFDDIISGRLVEPQLRKPDLPDALVEILMTALAMRPDDRFQDAGEMLAALEVLYPSSNTGLTGETGETGNLKLSIRPLPPQLGTGAMQNLSKITGEEPTLGGRPSTLGDRTPPIPLVSPNAPAEQNSLTSTGISAPASRGWVVGALLIVAALALGLSFALRTPSGGEENTSEEHAANAGDPDSDETPAVPLAGTALRYGVSRYLPEQEVLERHQPLARFLEQELDRPVEIVVVADYQDLAQRTIEGDVDLAALSAFHYVRAAEGNDGVRLLARATTRSGDSYAGVILSKADAGISQLSDFEGKDFCFVSPTSTSGYVYPRAHFRRAGLDPNTAFRATRFGGDHLSTLRALSEGACDGAAVAMSFFYGADDHNLAPHDFHVVASTERIPFDAYCAGSDTDPDIVAALQATLLRLDPEGEEAQNLFADVPGDLTGFIASSDADYQSVRDILEYLDE